MRQCQGSSPNGPQPAPPLRFPRSRSRVQSDGRFAAQHSSIHARLSISSDTAEHRHHHQLLQRPWKGTNPNPDLSTRVLEILSLWLFKAATSNLDRQSRAERNKLMTRSSSATPYVSSAGSKILNDYVRVRWPIRVRASSG